jgi:hypothetical protein
MIVNNVNRNAYVGLSGYNQDANDACFYGVKDIRDIEWNDKDKRFSFFEVNFLESTSHPTKNASLTSPLSFKIRREANDW